jgi:hypothetical protein
MNNKNKSATIVVTTHPLGDSKNGLFQKGTSQSCSNPELSENCIV